MTNLRQAAEMALEALEWFYGGEPMPTKELEAITALRQALAEWTPDDTAYRPDGLSQEELPPVKSYCGGKPNYCEPENTDKQCSSCGGFCGEVCEREDVEPTGEIVEAHGLIAVSIPKMPPVGTKLYAQTPKSEWVGLTTEQRNNIMQKYGNDWKRYTEEVERQIKENNGVLA